MHNSKLLVLLKTFSDKDLKLLHKFVQSPLHNTNKAALALFEYIHKYLPNFEATQLEKEKAFFKVVGKSKYNDGNMRRILSDLLNVCEDFVAWQRFRQNDSMVDLELLTFYREKKMDKHFNTVLRKLQKREAENTAFDEKHFYNCFRVEQEISEQIAQQQDRSAEPNLQVISDNLDIFYLIHKLKVCCSIISYQVLTKIDYQFPLLEEILVHLSKTDYNHLPLVCFYHYALLALMEGEEEDHFQNLRRVLFEYLEQIHTKEHKYMFLLARNYCIKRINKGDEQYLNELLELYKIELEKGIGLEHGFLSTFTYKNIVTLGIKIGDFAWTEDFIETYTEKLRTDVKKAAYSFNMARLHFSQKEFEKVIPLLHQNEYRELFVELNAKTILLKTYYELNELDPLFSLIESFRIYLRRKKGMNYHQTSYLNFIKCLRQLIRLEVANRKKILTFRTEIVEMKELTDKEWFLEKIDALVL